MIQHRRWQLFALLALAIVPLAWRAPAPAAASPAITPSPALTASENSQLFPETGFVVTGAFLQFWQRFGGLSRFGLPLSPAVRDPASGDLTVQYFERARFEWHPNNPAPYQVELTLLGAQAFGTRPERTAPPAGCATDCETFAPTNHTLRGAFRRYWHAGGGLPVFGYPLSEEFLETSQTDGKVYTVQYFERARFEHHPENAGTPYDVLLGQLGREALATRPDVASLPRVTVPDAPGNGKVIVLDAGHDRSTGGALGIEYRDTLRTVLALRAKLVARGYTVHLTRADDATTLLNDPALLPANAAAFDSGYREGYAHASKILTFQPDLAISIHYNAAVDGPGGGSTTYYCDLGGPQNARLAALVQRELDAALRASGYAPPSSQTVEDGAIGKSYGHLATLGNVNDPAGRWTGNRMVGLPIVLTEALFETNPVERRLLADDATLDRLAEAYARAIDAYFGR